MTSCAAALLVLLRKYGCDLNGIRTVPSSGGARGTCCSQAQDERTAFGGTWWHRTAPDGNAARQRRNLTPSSWRARGANDNAVDMRKRMLHNAFSADCYGRTVATTPSQALRRRHEAARPGTSWRGGERTRTADFYVANVALYQLSYTPRGTVQGTKGTRRGLSVRWRRERTRSRAASAPRPSQW
jgi:hypothetical protein